jgi:hypothetical protein
MSQALGDLLADRFDEPPTEITRIKEYVQKNFQTAVAVSVRGDKQIIITTRSSALAGALRPQLRQLATYSKTKKRLIIRIA